MIKHIVMYKLKDYSIANANALRDTFLSMRGKIAELVNIESGADVLRTDRSYDVVLICEFKTIADMDSYQNNPIHLLVKDYVKAVIVEAKAVDYEL